MLPKIIALIRRIALWLWPSHDPLLGLRQFAQSQNFEVIEAELPFYSIFFASDSYIPQTLVLQGTCSDLPFSMFQMYPTVDEFSQNRQNAYNDCAVVMQFAVPNDLFEFYLLSQPSVLATKIHPNPAFNYLALEGNFNHSFRLFVQDGQQQEAIQLFAPNVMENIMRHCEKYHLELAGGYFTVYREGFDMLSIASDVKHAPSLSALITDAEQVAEYVIKPLLKMLRAEAILSV